MRRTLTFVSERYIPQEPDSSTGLPVGPVVTRSESAQRPERIVLHGRYCRLEPLDPDAHGDQLFAASTPVDAAARFLYLPVEAHPDRADFDAWITSRATSIDPMYFVVIDNETNLIGGRQSFLRIDPPNQSIEIGDIYWGPSIARTRITTEANFLFATYAFDVLGYRRYEWKCNALNAPSKVSAIRFGFSYEGLFRRAAIVKGRSRDTSWYAMIDEEWPAIKRAYEDWLDPGNFDDQGQQRTSLAARLAVEKPQ
jgi:RimJ/RimL family protein N-acetyltransferase